MSAIDRFSIVGSYNALQLFILCSGDEVMLSWKGLSKRCWDMRVKCVMKAFTSGSEGESVNIEMKKEIRLYLYPALIHVGVPSYFI